MYLFGTLDPHPPTATPILGQSPKKDWFAVKITEWLFSLKSLGLWTPTSHSLGQSPKKNFFFTPSQNQLQASSDLFLTEKSVTQKANERS